MQHNSTLLSSAMLKPASWTRLPMRLLPRIRRGNLASCETFRFAEFWAAYIALPLSIRKQADANYQLLKRDPRHSWLQFKKVGRYWSVRVGRSYRALAVEVEDG